MTFFQRTGRARFRPPTATALLLTVLSALVGTSAHAADRLKLIPDDDVPMLHPAQLMALQSPRVDVLGITIVSGSTWRDENVAHALRMLEIIGRPEVPVVPGSAFPLVNTEKETERWESLFGKLVFKGPWMKQWVEDTVQTAPNYHAHDVVPDLPEGNPSLEASDEIAANFLIRKVREFPGEVTIIATGPLTNLALAQRLDPEFAATAKQLIYMGGSINPRQMRDSVSAAQFAREFINTPRLEFNFRWDPEAASITLRAPWKKITMIPVDPSTATELTPKLVERMSAAGTPLSKAFQDHLETGFPLWDEIAAAVWLDPSIITKSSQLYVDVDTSFSAGYGQTLSWSEHYQPGLGERLQTVVRAIDVDRLEDMMVELMNRPLQRRTSEQP